MNKAKHAFGNLADVQRALETGKINAFDILFLDGDTEPKIGWIDRNGNFRLVENETDFSELEAIIATKANVADVEALEIEMASKASADAVSELSAEVANKVTAEEVEAKIANKANVSDVDEKIEAANAYTNKMIEAAIDEHLTRKYEVTDVPIGTLINYREDEIRICCKADAEFVKQNVGKGGDASTYYCTFKTYAPNGAVGYREHLGGQVDENILTDLKTDEYGKKYQPTWLGLAKFNESTGAWTYYGANSTANHYIGWDYQIDFYDADNVMIASDSIRINLSNEDCHFTFEPYYVSEVKTEAKSYVETLVEEKIAEVNTSYEVLEF